MFAAHHTAPDYAITKRLHHKNILRQIYQTAVEPVQGIADNNRENQEKNRASYAQSNGQSGMKMLNRAEALLYGLAGFMV